MEQSPERHLSSIWLQLIKINVIWKEPNIRLRWNKCIFKTDEHRHLYNSSFFCHVYLSVRPSRYMDFHLKFLDIYKKMYEYTGSSLHK
jgi:hypothetical protein